jgi:hypothetical protein
MILARGSCPTKLDHLRHHAAVRALAFKWIRIIYKCWQSRTEYNEVSYLENLRMKGSPILAYAAANPD